ncbi:DNA-methyltransferase [Bosea thiooxidans]
MRSEQIGDCVLYNGDCLEVMAGLENAPDALVTDPPYGIEEMVGGYGRGGKHTIKNDKTLDYALNCLNLAGRLWGDLRVIAFYSCKVTPEFLSGVTELEYFGEVIWDKKVPGLGANFRYQHENAAIFVKGAPATIGVGFSVISCMRTPDLHPHQKPIPLMRSLVQLSAGKHILDPFMGCGSTGVACAQMGRKFTGIELDARYFDIACERISKAYAQGDMFVAPPPKQPAPDDLFANDNTKDADIAA